MRFLTYGSSEVDHMFDQVIILKIVHFTLKYSIRLFNTLFKKIDIKIYFLMISFPTTSYKIFEWCHVAIHPVYIIYLYIMYFVNFTVWPHGFSVYNNNHLYKTGGCGMYTYILCFSFKLIGFILIGAPDDPGLHLL